MTPDDAIRKRRLQEAVLFKLKIEQRSLKVFALEVIEAYEQAIKEEGYP